MTGVVGDREPIRLRPPRHRVERRAVGWWLLRALALVVPLVTGLAVGYALAAPARPWLGPALAAAGLLGPAYLLAPFRHDAPFPEYADG